MVPGLPDISDAPFLEVALSESIPLVTGNIRHYPANRREGSRVLLPRELDETRLKGYAAAGRELKAAPGDPLQVRLAQVPTRQDLLRLEAIHALATGT